MHTIQVPGTGVGEKHEGQHPDDHVALCCLVDLQFQVKGVFSRGKKGDEFYHKLPHGTVKAASEYQCTSPNHPIVVKWKFEETATGTVTRGKIIVDEDGDCKSKASTRR
jgi:hypothetical protein